MNLEDLSEPVRAEQITNTPLLEKFIALLGLLIVLFVLSVTAYEAKTYDDKLPEIEIENKGIVAQKQGFLVKISAKNIGSQATAGLQIEGEIGEGEEKETSALTLDFVPAHSVREGGLFFRKNPEGVKLRALGYQKP